MTYGVPYSFVPGTKAKADEVNANFVDIIGKLEDTNARIDSTNSTVEANQESANALVESARTDLSADYTAKLALKANNSDIYGQWKVSKIVLFNGVSLNGTSLLTYSLENYLPNDDNIYEVRFEGYCIPSSTTVSSINLSVGSQIVSATSVCRTRSMSGGVVFDAASTIMLPVGRNRQFIVNRSSNYVGTATVTLLGYRKIR